MELNFSEIEEQNSKINNYWEQPKKVEQKKKKVSFDDILTNMNLVISKDGTLQSMIPKTNIFNYNNDFSQQQQPSSNIQQSHNYNKQEPLDPSVKHSFIYNKYFKDYKDATTPEPVIRVPKTKEEYKQMLLEDKMNRIKQKKRISEIKSTKLFFTTNAGQNGAINSSRNNLRSMNFY
jgi:hypothetical protein